MYNIIIYDEYDGRPSWINYLMSFDTEEEALEFCESHNWEWINGNGFLWDMDYFMQHAGQGK